MRTRRTQLSISLASLTLWLLAPSPALAANGVLEINQTCAVQTGCFPGDTAGFPVTIVRSLFSPLPAAGASSFVLTSDLETNDSNVNALEIGMGDVTIDLAGFSIRCMQIQGTPPFTSKSFCYDENSSSTNPADAARAIWEQLMGALVALPPSRMENGRISGFAGGGIESNASIIVEDLEITNNGGPGIRVTGDAPATIRNVTASSNGGAGIEVGSGSIVENSAAHNNGAEGIIAGSGSRVTQNVANQNGGDGILVGDAANVSHNTSYSNLMSGITAGSGSHIRTNTISGNGGPGLSLAENSPYAGNVLTQNGGGNVLLGLDLGGNFCGDGGCP